MKRIILKPGEERRILLGHPWVYDNEIARVLSGRGPRAEPADLQPGELADVESSGKEYLGRAFVNPNSKIRARIYSPSKEGVDKGFFKNRLRSAITRRMNTFHRESAHKVSARLVFAEADFLPGLIIDRFVGWPMEALEPAVNERPFSFEDAEKVLGPPASWLSIQFLCWAMDERKKMIIEALEEVLSSTFSPEDASPGLIPIEGIVEKSGAKVRELEGLPVRECLIKGTSPSTGIVIFENDLPFVIHIEEGQKTGHFLDQKENRRLTAAYFKEGNQIGDSRVLDAFAYTGGFGIHAVRAGAGEVVCVDVSGRALETLKKNAGLNGVGSRIKTVEADIFEYLRMAERRKERFDLIILDPPAFAKSRPSLDNAIRGYKEINLRAVSLLRKGGILVTCSCSQALDEARFRRIVSEAAADAERRLIQLDFRYQAPDHPVLMGYDESLYLKCGFYQVI
jgi:23S rRNA (cytosine1962-C5)-methyltransferase